MYGRMKPEDYKQFQYKLFAEIQEMTAKKAADYSGDEDTFNNFMLCEKIGMATAEQGILIRTMDKISRLQYMLKRGENLVPGESIEDAAKDIIGYMSALLGILHEKNITTREIMDSDYCEHKTLRDCCYKCKKESVCG